ncbi:MAG: ribosomal protein methyltransferase [Verrucomicrobiota bacterium]
MFVWQKRASRLWLAANETALAAAAGQNLAIIVSPLRKTVIAEVADDSRRNVERLHSQFGGEITILPPDWLKRFAESRVREPISVGRRLRILGAKTDPRTANEALVIPAGAAFGTGDHLTTAMSLRLLEQISRRWEAGWSMLDLGTGSGILALAAKMLGAKRVVGIDLDSVAIATAKENARLNKMSDIEFRIADARRLNAARQFEIVSANLFSELLIQILPRIARSLKRAGFAALSGILRNQEADLADALRGARLHKRIVRRRGKWVAVLAQKQI